MEPSAQRHTSPRRSARTTKAHMATKRVDARVQTETHNLQTIDTHTANGAVVKDVHCHAGRSCRRP